MFLPRVDKDRLAALLLPSGIFWRTFFLIALLIGASLIVWFQSFRVLEREPRAQQNAQTIISVVNVTRAALVHSEPSKRRSLLIDLANNEGIRIYPEEDNDRLTPFPKSEYLSALESYIHAKLGKDTRLAQAVNGQPGLWVNFTIDGDGYWVAFNRDRVDVGSGLRWVGWGATALVLSLLGAALISRLINLPLKRLTAAARTLGHGSRPPPLPEVGAGEIREANASFNAMVTQLERIESDRALLLAGISHDLRTPLTRLRLEIEMSAPDEETRAAMSADIEQMDAIIGQFLDYARPAADGGKMEEIDLEALVQHSFNDTVVANGVDVTLALEHVPPVLGHVTEIGRLLDNLIENARRYARPADGGPAQVRIAVRADDDSVLLEVKDNGPGVPPHDLERLKRPFTRLDQARGQANGAGLGLAIVARIAERHKARFELHSAAGDGLCARIIFPRATSRGGQLERKAGLATLARA